MWTTTALVNGAWQEFAPVVIEDALPALALVRTAVASSMTYAENLAGHLREEDNLALTGKFVGSHDAIARWSALAESEKNEYAANSPGKIEALEEGLAYFAGSTTPTPEQRPDTLAWHDHTTAIIPIPANARHLTIDYTPTTADQNRVERYKKHVTKEHVRETILDARGYFGTGTAIIDFWSSMRQQGWGYRASFSGMSGFIVARVLRRLTVKQPTLDADPLFDWRLNRMSERFRHIADGCPDLAHLQEVRSHNDAVVFVHGTVSTSFPGLNDLLGRGTFPHPVYRFEHDTFLPIETNAQDLVSAMRNFVQARRLLLVAHSRGGLVGRVALAQLRRHQYPGETYLQTFGTPHEGTPFADVGGKFLNFAYKLGCEMIGSVPAMYPLVAAYSYVINCPTLPAGIDIMRQSSNALGVMNAVSDPAHTRCWASIFDIAKSPTGFGSFASGALIGAMSGIDHDLVVPTASALAFGKPEPLLACSHVQYFVQPQVKQAIAAIVPAPPVAAFAAAAGVGEQQDVRPLTGADMALAKSMPVSGPMKPHPRTSPSVGPVTSKEES